MNNYTIFISSSDNYSDIWNLFFDLFKKYWPEYDGEIVLNTENLDYHRSDLNIRCTRVGKLDSFGKTLRAGLETIDNKHILLVMIDYIFMAPVNCKLIEKYYNFFVDDQLDSLCLVNQNYPNTIRSAKEDIMYVIPPAPNQMFSYQIAFWKKSVLLEMALPHENPWMSEWYGSKRAEKMRIRLGCPIPNSERAIFYDLAGCLHQGKWLKKATFFLDSIGYNYDFEQRGYYTNEYRSLNFRFKLKVTIWLTGLMGSYWDLYRRKSIHN